MLAEGSCLMKYLEGMMLKEEYEAYLILFIEWYGYVCGDRL